MKLSPKPRQNAITMLNWFQQQADFSELEEQGKMEIYHSAMQWFAETLGNIKYVQLEDEDVECLLALRSNSKNLDELWSVTGYNTMSLRQRMYKLVNRGLVISYLEEKPGYTKLTYYKLSPYGNKELLKMLEDPIA